MLRGGYELGHGVWVADIEGARDDYVALAKLVRQGSGSMACSGLYPPYEHVLQEIIVTGEGDGALATIRVDPEKGRLHLAGGKQGLEILATNIEGFGEEEEIDHHQHIEYFPDHVYLAEGSDALILNLEDE